MKTQIAILALMAFPVLLSGQDTQKVEEALGAKVVEALEKNNPEELAYLAFKADQCFAVQDLSGKKDISNLEDITVLNGRMKNAEGAAISADNFTKGQFNPLRYDFGTEGKMAYYRIGDSGKLLKIYAEERCRSLFDQSK